MLKRIICLLMLVTLALGVFGCRSYLFSPDRQYRRRYVIMTDLEHFVDDLDWVLGLDKPSMLYERY